MLNDRHKQVEPNKTMKISILSALAIAAILFIFGFMTSRLAVGAEFQTREHGVIQVGERKVEDFKAFGLAIPADLTLSQGSPQKIFIKADNLDLANIETEVSGSKLEIKSKHDNYRYGKVMIVMTVPNIEGIAIAGSGRVTAATPVRADKLRVEIAGSGNVTISDLVANDLNGNILGSGGINISGKNISNAKFRISGSGNIHAYDLRSSKVKVGIAGSGNVEVYAENRLEVEISGSGDVFYKGKPVINFESNGSGKMHNAN